jgi:hypothetical protein
VIFEIEQQMPALRSSISSGAGGLRSVTVVNSTGARGMKQAETQKSAANGAVTARLPETYQWLLVPTQQRPEDPVDWQATRLSGQESLAARASKRLRNDELLITSFAPSRLRMELDNVPLWRGDHVSIRQLTDDFGRYVYLPRLKDPSVLAKAIRDGLGMLMWEQDSFAYAESYDEGQGRYRGLRTRELVSVDGGDSGLLVRPEAAILQIEREESRVPPPPGGGEANGGTEQPGGGGAEPGNGEVTPPVRGTRKLRRFHGTVALDPERPGRDAGRIAEEVIAHLTGLMGATVRVTLEIDADIADGAPENVVRTVTENSNALKFTSAGFEES